MSEIASASINTFGRESQLPKANFVPSSEQLITLTYDQLQELVTRTIQDAIHPLQDHVSSLDAMLACQDEKIAVLEATEPIAPILQEIQNLRDEHIKDRAVLESFKMSHCAFAIRTTEDIDQLFAALDPKPQPLQKDRADILRALLVANGGKLFAKDARRKMHLSKNRFSELLKICDFIETKPYHLDRRQTIIILKSKLVPRN